MVTDDNIKSGKIGSIILISVALVVSPFTSWFLFLYVLCLHSAVIAIIVTFNVMSKKKNPVSLAFGQLDRALSSMSNIIRF